MLIKGHNEIIGYSIAYLKDDYTELWIIAAKIQDLNPEFSADEVLAATKAIVAQLVTDHGAAIFDTEKMAPIIKTKKETIDILVKHIDNLKGTPNIGDGLWLTIENQIA